MPELHRQLSSTASSKRKYRVLNKIREYECKSIHILTAFTRFNRIYSCSSSIPEECQQQASSFHILPPVISAKLITRNHFHTQYGIIEIRAKFPEGDWLYPGMRTSFHMPSVYDIYILACGTCEYIILPPVFMRVHSIFKFQYLPALPLSRFARANCSPCGHSEKVKCFSKDSEITEEDA